MILPSEEIIKKDKDVFKILNMFSDYINNEIKYVYPNGIDLNIKSVSIMSMTNQPMNMMFYVDGVSYNRKELINKFETVIPIHKYRKDKIKKYLFGIGIEFSVKYIPYEE